MESSSDDDDDEVVTPRNKLSSRVIDSDDEDEAELSQSILKRVGERSKEMQRRRSQKQNTFEALRRKNSQR